MSSSRTTRSKNYSAVAACVATAASVSFAHLAAAVIAPASSPLLVVGSVVIDATPTPVKQWAIANFGTADKPILNTSVALVVLAAAFFAGRIPKNKHVTAAVLAALVAVVWVLSFMDRQFSGTWFVTLFVVAATGLGLWYGLDKLINSPEKETQSAVSSRRSFLIGVGVVSTLSAFAALSGQLLIRAKTSAINLVLPKAAQPLAALPNGLEDQYQGLSSFVTAQKDLYRVDINLVVPLIDENTWELVVDGQVDNPLRLTLNELFDFEIVERDITLNCVSNSVGGPYIGSGRWLGVRLADVLEKAGVQSGADQILSTSVDGYTASTPLDVALDGRDTLLAFGFNGEPLSREHGYPVRLLTPGLYGYVGATKWLTKLTVTTYDEDEAYWTKRGWAIDAPVKVASRIDTPRGLSSLSAGTQAIAGVAWCQQRGIEKVEVKIDDGPWQEATLGEEASIDYWVQWYLPWDATTGRHTLQARATTKDGEVQTAERVDPFPNGATGIHSIVVTVK